MRAKQQPVDPLSNIGTTNGNYFGDTSSGRAGASRDRRERTSRAVSELLISGTLFARSPVDMRIRLTRKLSERIDGIDISPYCVGQVLDLPAAKARLLVAEEWATTEERRKQNVGPPRIERRHEAAVPLASRAGRGRW